MSATYRPEIRQIPEIALLVPDEKSANIYKDLHPYWTIFKYGDRQPGVRFQHVVIVDDIFPRCDNNGVTANQVCHWLDNLRTTVLPGGTFNTLSRFRTNVCHSD